ncbi:MAG: response regulator [Thiolinea sp.]
MEDWETERLAFAEELEEVALQLSLQDPGLPLAERLEQVRSEYERLAMAADMFGLPQITDLLAWAGQSLSQPQAEALLDQGHYYGWIERVALAFREPEEVGHLPLLMAALMAEDWPEPLPPEQLEALLLSLRPLEADDAATADQESAADNPLRFAADVHPELLDAFMTETPGQVSEAARLIRLIAIGAGTTEQRRQAARLAHTLKGSSSVVGVEPIARFTHRLEDLLDLPLRDLDPTLGHTLEAAADCLETLFDHLQNDAGLPEDYQTLYTALQEGMERLQAEQADGGNDELPTLNALTELPDFLRDEQAEEEESADSGPAAPDSQTFAPNLSEARIQDLLGLTGELITSTSQTAELLQQARALSAQLYQQDEQIRRHLDELEGLVEQRQDEVARTATGRNTLIATGQGQTGNTAFDTLELESYSDLYSTASLLNEAAADSREMAHELQSRIRQLSDGLYQQQRVQRQLSEAVLGLRLAPVQNLVPRLQRIVRKPAAKTGKQADIHFTGQQLLADTGIIKGVTDPLLHLLRNAVDHGIETPEARRALGKPDTGRIHLQFARQGNYIHLTLEDDGAGMDPQRIRERALERGLISADQDLQDDALLRLVLLPGFSTRDEVSEVSGRGVGMDVVQAGIERLRGSLRLDSEAGQGTRISISLPQTLISTHALVVRAAGHLVAIPADTVEQLLYVTVDEQQWHEDGSWQVNTERYQAPVMRLADILHWPAPPVTARQAHTLLMVHSETSTYALYVEEILPSRDIVINSLAPWLNFIHSIQGACILANGTVAPVLDMLRLLHELESGDLQPLNPLEPESVATDSRGPVRSLLVVDDSLSNRKSMRLMLEGMGYRVHTAVDGMDALKLMNELEVDLVLTDLEMPRMNGLEMTQAIRIWPERKHLPIVMVTSRGTRKHRDLAQEAGVDGYLTKPVGTAVLAQEVEKWLDTTLTIDKGAMHG